MPSHAELAARLLRDAAVLFRGIGRRNDALRPQMEENAEVFDQVAGLVERDPTGEVREDVTSLARSS